MRNFNAIIAIAAAIVLAASGCTRNLYVPYSQPVTLFNQKGDFQVSVSASNEAFKGVSNYKDSTSTAHKTHLNYTSSGVNAVVQGAYAITDNIAVSAGLAFYRKGTKDPADPTDYDASNYGEAAAGYYTKLGSDLIAEVYGGFGLSSQHHKFSTAGMADIKSSKIFIQPNLGFVQDLFEAGISTRLSYLKYFGLNNKIDPSISYWANSDHIYMNDATHRNFWLLEPALTMRMGWQSFKVQYQLAFVLQLNNKDYILHGLKPFSHRHYVGIVYTFGRK